MMNVQKAVIARAKMCEIDLDRVTIESIWHLLHFTGLTRYLKNSSLKYSNYTDFATFHRLDSNLVAYIGACDAYTSDAAITVV